MNDIAGTYPLGYQGLLSTCALTSEGECGWKAQDNLLTYPKEQGRWSNKQYCDGASSLVAGMGVISFLISLN